MSDREGILGPAAAVLGPAVLIVTSVCIRDAADPDSFLAPFHVVEADDAVPVGGVC